MFKIFFRDGKTPNPSRGDPKSTRDVGSGTEGEGVCISSAVNVKLAEPPELALVNCRIDSEYIDVHGGVLGVHDWPGVNASPVGDVTPRSKDPEVVLVGAKLLLYAPEVGMDPRLVVAATWPLLAPS